MIVLNFFLIVALIIIFGFYVYCKKCFTFWKKKGVYNETPVVPFGNTTNLIFHKESLATEFGRLYEECRKKSIPFCGFYFFTTPLLVIADLELIKSITKTAFDHFTDRVFHSSDTDPLSLNMISLRGSRWSIMRKKLSPVFTPRSNRLMHESIKRCNSEMLSQVGIAASNGECVDIKDMAARFTIDVITNCAFGLKCKTLKNENNEYVDVGNSFFSTSLMDYFMILINMLNPKIFNALNVKSTKPYIEKFFSSIAKIILTERADKGVVKKDFMHMLLQMQNNVNIKLNKIGNISNKKSAITPLCFSDIAAQCFVFFMAGFETSSSVIAFCLYELALNNDYQNQIREEVKIMLKKHGGKLSYDLVMDLKFTQRCIKETLRKHSPGSILTRECTKDYKIPSSDVILKKGAIVVIPIYGVHFDPNIYPDPEKFDPERFSEKNSAKRHPCAFLPFGYGPRNCIAFQFGFLESTLAVASLVYNFKLKLKSLTRLPLVMDFRSIVVRPKYGIFIDFEKKYQDQAISI